MAKKKNVKIEFVVSQKEYDEMFEELFEEITNSYADGGGDDGEDDYCEPQDEAREYFDGMSESEIIKEYLMWKK